MKNFIILLVALLMMVPVMAQDGLDACTQATMDAQADQDGIGWMAAGFCCGAFGWGAAYVMDADQPDAARLLGKDVNYVTVYSQCYQEEGKEIQTSSAMKGCVASVVFNLVMQVMAAG